jgi:signal transduction histidine kinase
MSKRASIVLIAVSLLVYIVLVPLLFPILGGAVVGFIVIPIMVISWHTGMKLGFVSGFFGVLVLNSFMLAYLYHELSVDVLRHHQGIPGLIMLTLLGGGAGYFRELRDRYVGEINARMVAQRELERKNREIVDLINTITHDLRNPLTGIRGILEIHCMDAVARQVNEKDIMDYRLALREVDYMQDLLEDLLELAQLDTKNAGVEWKPVDVAEVVRKAVELYKPQLSKRSVAVAISIDGVSLFADSRALEKVFMNLVGNAINYMGTQPQPSITIAAADDGCRVALRVTDNGMGIPAAALPFVFDKFRRGPNVGSIKGTGLGLSIVKGIAEAHGGTVTVQSVEGAGSTFTITIPHRAGEGV